MESSGLLTSRADNTKQHLHRLLEVDGILPGHRPVLGLALDVDDLVLGQAETSEGGVPHQEAEPGLPLLLALHHPAGVEAGQVQQVDVREAAGRDAAARGVGALLQYWGGRVAWGQSQYCREPRVGLHLETVNLCKHGGLVLTPSLYCDAVLILSDQH